MNLLSPPRTARTPSCQPHGASNDKLLVLTLAVILSQNHAPIELILALLYIAM